MNTSNQQETTFTFTVENQMAVKHQIAKYPKGRQQSAVIAVLALAQSQSGGWLPQSAIESVATTLEMPKIRVMEVATFYSMFNLTPVGRFVVQICTTTPCALRGSAGIEEACQQHLKVALGETTPDSMFTLREVECLGACVNAPMMQVGENYYEDLTPESAISILEALARGAKPVAGSQSGRQTSAPAGGPRTLVQNSEGRD